MLKSLILPLSSTSVTCITKSCSGVLPPIKVPGIEKVSPTTYPVVGDGLLFESASLKRTEISFGYVACVVSISQTAPVPFSDVVVYCVSSISVTTTPPVTAVIFTNTS